MSFQAYLDNIEEKTGLTARQYIAFAHERGFDSPATNTTTAGVPAEREQQG